MGASNNERSCNAPHDEKKVQHCIDIANDLNQALKKYGMVLFNILAPIVL